MAKTYTVNNTHEAKKVILKIIMNEAGKRIGNKPIKINVK